MDERAYADRADELTIIRSSTARRSAGEGPRAWFLVMVEGAEPGRRIRLGEMPLVIGRTAPADLVLHDTEISRRHCAVVAHPMFGLSVTDFDSTNGSYIDGRRVAGVAPLPDHAFLQLGGHVFRCERLAAGEASQIEALSQELRRASDYVRALLPPPLDEGPVVADWAFQPSAHLGGDAFGYQWLDDRRFAFHLIDVSGHGTSAALHSASIINVLRHRSLPDTAFERPAAVVARLNAAFPMERHAGMCFTVWYGVYDRLSRQLEFCSAGHHPAYLLGADDRTPRPLQTRNLLVGALPNYAFRSAAIELAPASRLYLFSDGVFESRGDDGAEGRLQDLLPLLGAAGAAGSPAELLRAARHRARAGVFEDDFTLMRLQFP